MPTPLAMAPAPAGLGRLSLQGINVRLPNRPPAPCLNVKLPIRKTPSPRAAFGLVELVVVIAVVATLAAITFPAIRSVAARAQSAKCLGNLRQLGVALNTYLADNNLRMPDLKSGRAERSEEVPVIDNTLNAYLDSAAPFACPADRTLAAKSGTSYYWNSALSGQAVASLNLFAIIDTPSHIPVLVDKEGWHRFTDEKVNHLFADGHATKELRLFAK